MEHLRLTGSGILFLGLTVIYEILFKKFTLDFLSNGRVDFLYSYCRTDHSEASNLPSRY